MLTKQYTTKIIEMYKDGQSAREIVYNLNLPISTRQLQRYLKAWGIVRSVGDSFRLAVSQGKITYHKKPFRKKRKTLGAKMRYLALQRDNFKCRLCGNTAQFDRIQVDHIDNDPTNNTLENLQTLCESCNKGKSYTS